MDQMTTNNGVEFVQKLPATDDEFGGVVVEMKEHMDSDVFRTLLKTSMSQWKLQGKKGVWIKLPIDLSNLVDTAVKEGFWYHHAEPNYLMLLYWIPKTINPIPGNASHIARVGAIVLNDKREMLVVQEKMGTLRGVWKISTGIIHEGEDIIKGLVREVKEETGIDTEFVEVLAFSQEHNVFFGKSEILFLCMMRPLSFEIQIQETEIEAAKWMPLEEYASQISVQEQGLRKYITELCIAKTEWKYSGFSPFPVSTDSNGCRESCAAKRIRQLLPNYFPSATIPFHSARHRQRQSLADSVTFRRSGKGEPRLIGWYHLLKKWYKVGG